MDNRLQSSFPHISPVDTILRLDRIAFIKGDCCWTHERLAIEADCLTAGMITFGVQPGDRICLHLRNGPEIAAAYYACFRLGAIAVPMYLRSTPAELESVLRHVRPALYLGEADLYGNVAEIDPAILAENARFMVGSSEGLQARPWLALLGDPADAPAAGRADPHAPAVLLTTSGTTGQPKYVAHSLDALSHITAGATHLGFSPGQVLAFIVPMTHASGLSLFIAAMRIGVTVVFIDSASSDAILDAIEEHRCTIFGGTPMTIAQIIKCQRRQPRDVSSLRLCFTSADACPPGQQDEFLSVFGLMLRSFWASTEAMSSFTYGLPTGAVSRLQPHTELRLVDTDGTEVPPGQAGEMLLRGPDIMLGYWTGPSLLKGKQDGWYRSGDLMRQDEDGNVWFVSRLKDLIVRGGSNISPVEVEQVLSSHPAVCDAAVVGVPDPVLGQRVLGLVCINDLMDVGQLGDILHSASTQLAAYKLPERLLTISEIPRNRLGKVDRMKLAIRVQAAF